MTGFSTEAWMAGTTHPVPVPGPFAQGPGAYAAATAAVAVTVGLAFLLHRLMPHANLSLLFLVAVLVVAARAGLGPSLLASVLSFLSFNYFFTQPFYTLQVADDGDVATLIFFLAVAAVTGNLAARMQREIRRRHASLQRLSALFDFSRLMSSTADAETIVRELAAHLHRSLDRPASVMVSTGVEGRELRVTAGDPPKLPDASDSWTRFPLEGAHERVGSAAVFGALESEQADWARSLCEQAGVAIDRTRLAADLEETRVEYETEQLRSALLSSVSHDLRTPLASIIGSTTSLLEYGESFSPQDRRELMQMVVEESRRLDRHIQNLLDMTRIGQGGLQLRRDWVDLHDVVSSALQRLEESSREVRIELELAGELPLLWVHGVLIEQALVNLLDNAIRFSPVNGRVSVAARKTAGDIEIDVCDQGPGIPESERELVFDMFYTARHGDRGQRQGTGLGLTICRGMIGAHGGNVTALAGPGGKGTCMRVSLPLVSPGGGDA